MRPSRGIFWLPARFRRQGIDLGGSDAKNQGIGFGHRHAPGDEGVIKLFRDIVLCDAVLKGEREFEARN